MDRDDEDCEDIRVRNFLLMMGWNIEDPASVERNADAWRYIKEQYQNSQAFRSRRAAVIVAAICTLMGSLITGGGPMLIKLLKAVVS